MPQVTRVRLPQGSDLWRHYRDGDFMDCYAVTSTLSPKEAAMRGLALPRWAAALLALRNALVRPFGLKTEADREMPSVGLFPIRRDDPQEFILGLDDRHLDFRITVFREGAQLHLSTWVHAHNIWGRAYLACVMPAHILISRGAAARMAD